MANNENLLHAWRLIDRHHVYTQWMTENELRERVAQWVNQAETANIFNMWIYQNPYMMNINNNTLHNMTEDTPLYYIHDFNRPALTIQVLVGAIPRQIDNFF